MVMSIKYKVFDRNDVAIITFIYKKRNNFEINVFFFKKNHIKEN